MSGTYSVSLQALENAVVHADTVGTAIGNLLAELEGDVEQKLSSWTGDARESYITCKRQWDQAAAEMPTSLATARQTLEVIAEQYDAAEKSAIDTFFGGIR